MAAYQVISWRDIPVIVEARDRDARATRQLSERFQALVDAVAMQLGLQESDAYLAQWTRTDAVERPGSADEVAAAVAEELESRFQDFALAAFRHRP